MTIRLFGLFEARTRLHETPARKVIDSIRAATSIRLQIARHGESANRRSKEASSRLEAGTRFRGNR